MLKAFFVFGFCSASLFAAAFQNGNFEGPSLAGAGISFSTVPTGWTKVDATSSALFLQDYSTFGLPTLNGDPVQAYGFGGNGGGSGSLSQTFDTVAGAPYQVGFIYAVQQGFEFEDLGLSIFNNASAGGTPFVSSFIRFNNRNWLGSTLNFTAGGPETTLQFNDITGIVDPGTGGSTNWALDAVTVTGASPTATPEPSTFVLLGFATLGILSWRGRNTFTSRNNR